MIYNRLIICILIFSLSFFTSYSQVKTIKLSHYVFPEFVQGVILMKTGIENKILLNYNSLTEEMIFKEKERKFAIVKEQLEQIDTVFINDRKFVMLDDKFIELIYHSKFDLYAEHKCKVNKPGKPSAYGGTSETSATTLRSSFDYGGNTYELKLPDGYKTKPYTYYWLKRNGKLNRFINMRQMIKLFKNKKNLFKAYVKKHDVNYNNQESIVQLIKYLETN